MIQRAAARYMSGAELAVVVVLVVGVLYAAKPIAVPFALALLLAFVLSPVVATLERLGLRRAIAVALTALLALSIVASVVWLVGRETRLLAVELPKHKDRIRAKLESLRGTGEGAFGPFFGMVRDLTEGPLGFTVAADEKIDAASVPSQPVVIAPPKDSPLLRFVAVASPVVEPLASVALVIVLVVFMLANKEDLRDRLIGLLGRGRLTGTTLALEDAAERVGRYLLSLLAINVVFGIVLTIGLAVIGVAVAPLWGFLGAVLRFIPYLGTWAAAVFPLLLSAATAPGWVQPLEVLLLFVALDVIIGQVIEPLVFGHGTGVSPFALLVAATFWAWLWGPIGLLLSTPMTVCLVVLGQNAPRLHFLALLLGRAPALPPAAQLYQRLLAQDDYEATRRVVAYAAEHGWDAAFDELLVPALVMARWDRRRDGLPPEREALVVSTLRGIVAETAKSIPESNAAINVVVVGAPAHHLAEEPILDMLGLLVRRDGVRIDAATIHALPAEIVSRAEALGATATYVSVLPPGGLPQAAYLCRLLRARFPGLKIVVGWQGDPRRLDKILVRLRQNGADYVTTSLREARGQLLYAAAIAQPTS